MGDNVKAIVLDTETTDLKDPEVIEAAWYEMVPGRDLLGDECLSEGLHVGEKYCERFNPHRASSVGALAVHHILPSELEGCRPSREFRLPPDTGYIIGHTVDFDWEAIGRPDVKRVDTCAIARWLWPDVGAYSQGALIYFLLGQNQVARAMVSQAHGAEADVRMCLTILRQVLQRKPEIKNWYQLWEYSEECRIPKFCPFKNREGYLLEELDDDYIRWALSQDWIDGYLRAGLERVMDDRHGEGEWEVRW